MGFNQKFKMDSKMKNICIVEFPSNLGLKEPTPGKEPGVKQLPNWLQKHHFHHQINPQSVIRLNPPKYNNKRDTETGILNIDSITDYSIKQAELIQKLLADHNFPFVLGGDCSIILGPAIALKQSGNFGLFYLDGHTDYMNIALSETGGVGGMGASLVTGYGPDKLTNILGLSPYIKEENLWCVGNREYDEQYEDEIRNANAKYTSLEMLREQGMINCAQSFLEEIERKQLDGFWVHIDVDVLNDELMPCVDSRTPDGLTYNEFNQLTHHLFKSPKLTGVEITILDPDLDPDGRYTKDFVFNLTNIFNSARQQ